MLRESVPTQGPLGAMSELHGIFGNRDISFMG